MTAIEPSWLPDPARVQQTRIVRFAQWLVGQGRASLDDVTDYRALHAWSVASPGDFWAAVADFFGVDWETPPRCALAEHRMPGAEWFPGGTLNFGRHLLRAGDDDQDAVILVAETGERSSITYGELRAQAAAVAGRLRGLGVAPGDRVAAYLPNCVEGVVAFVATALVGAVWAQTGLDYAAPSAAQRMAQLSPRVLITGSGYRFGGKVHDRRDDARQLRELLPELRHTITVETAGLTNPADGPDASTWAEALAAEPAADGLAVGFDHPLWVLFTSGTTGRPKGVVHGHGGVLLEQLVSPGLHMDLRAGDVFFWFTTPNWMMWNAQVCGLLHGATIVLYDGRPTWPGPDALWRLVADLGVAVFGTSPGYLEASQRAGLAPGRELGLSALRLVGVTGSVLPGTANAWFREHVSPQVQLGSMSGGTDIVGIFVASAPTTPVYDGEISAPALGAAVQVWHPEGGRARVGVPGEMVITEPMPSMPLHFWDDPDGQKLRDTYFDMFPGVWRHGDLTMMTERGTVVILGRSDATINRHGVRLGSAEIYAAISDLPEVADALVVGVEEPDGGYWLPLFVVPNGDGRPAELVSRIRRHIVERTSPRHVPDEVILLPSLPHTKTGKRLEVPVKRILQGADPERVIDRGAVDDPAALDMLITSARERRREP
ncbi:acetoacetyl-CoA synthetase [Micromonospora phaseoli]|uniref:Acetoacetyl-CoA synthetase n=1 Tax=Micromonospora phaseoli TaxID=1144548 RepID=A0A1H6VAQ8_9ACTN|nr:acetoacetate--CoA ligase [Micromonospora phaseoli]PZV93793.1 acetoacetyl-CoA synthetase [Micromonospora phaseoli]GIJ79931.1 acetoacetyl-CoA synthetase [Micromonospora phaseoli]SEI97372.1 acetoacetyl-CoA synthetase [Micromonospora phaseoli]